MSDRKRVVDEGAPGAGELHQPVGTVAPPVVAVPASGPGTAPAGGTLSDAATDDPGESTVKGAPVVEWVAAWAKLAVVVDPDRAKVRAAGPQDDPTEERYVTVTGPNGRRDVVLEGLQVVLHAGETLPPETVHGQGALLHSFGAVNAVSTG